MAGETGFFAAEVLDERVPARLLVMRPLEALESRTGTTYRSSTGTTLFSAKLIFRINGTSRRLSRVDRRRRITSGGV